MSGTLAMYQKELWTYFRSPIAYFVVAAFLLGTGYFFTYNIFLTPDGQDFIVCNGNSRSSWCTRWSSRLTSPGR